MLAAVVSRHVSAGITPAPGFTSQAPVWWGATDWTEFEVRGALRANHDVCREHHVAPDTVLSVARGMARFADGQTGRECRPTNERLVTVARVSLSTVQRARRVLKELGLVVEVVAGRSNMTLTQRLAAWERGSSHRRLAAEFALCSRRDRAPRPQPDLQLVDRDTPPVGQVVRRSATEIRGSLQSTDATKRPAPRAAHTEKVDRPVDLRPRRLAEGTRARLPWLSGVSARRLTPALHRFALAGWTPRDVELAAADALAARGWRRPPVLKQPAAYLALLLRELDPADRPTVMEAHMEEMDRAARAAARELDRREHEYERLRIYGPPCPHGEPAGDLPSPEFGVMSCPFCRANTTT